MLISCVRCLTGKSRVRCIDSAACSSGVFTATNRMVGRITASQNRFCIGWVGLAALHIWLDVSRRHQANLMAELYQLLRPVMRRAACFDTNQARTSEPDLLSPAADLIGGTLEVHPTPILGPQDLSTLQEALVLQPFLSQSPYAK